MWRGICHKYLERGGCFQFNWGQWFLRPIEYISRMADTYTGDIQTLYLPLDIIQSSAGFAFDFGKIFVVVDAVLVIFSL